MKKIALVCAFLMPTASSFTQDTINIFGYDLELHNYERVEKNEKKYTDETVKIIGEFFKRQYKNGKTRRGVHPKTHGCYEAKMVIEDDIPEKDQVGIFVPGKEYKTFLRFSNGGPRPGNVDSEADTRGIGIKVLGLDGPNLLPLEKEVTQDFTLNSSDSFFADSVKDYSRFMRFALLETETFGEAALQYIIDTAKRFEPAKAFRIFKAFDKIQSVKATTPLGLDYFSITAFQHGAGKYSEIVKYKVTPCEGNWSEKINEENDNFLRENLNKHLSKKSACFSFQVQKMPRMTKNNRRSLPAKTKVKLVERPTAPWKAERSEFKEFAKIHIPSQKAMDEKVCQRSVINPWNTLEEHKPVGGINRMRLAAYLFSIQMRSKHQRPNK